MGAVVFRDLLAGDVVQLALQPSQHRWLGMTRPVHSYQDGEELVAGGPGWTAVGADGRILCCAGFKILWPANDRTAGHAVAWAMLASGLGPAHLAITRYAAARIAESSLSRIEAIVRAGKAAEPAWAAAVGLRHEAVLEAWGPDGDAHHLYARVK